MKLKIFDIDYEEMYLAIDKLENGESLSDQDRKNLLKIVKNAEGSVFPNRKDYKQQQQRRKQIGELEEQERKERQEQGLEYIRSVSQQQIVDKMSFLVKDSEDFESNWY
ncbi:hypothetical protein IGI96_002299 [Enterococcus sp. DIV0421]|uniref:hypothetical protein n=1 Tax=Enterococcus TaxID=1350 RepID=UPI000A34E268|nr:MULTISPECIES: hypothetical protein [Enterococcus]OTO01164.1 hypothetical protein A5883_003481 [Enterococcus sp. 5B3_DIV0040]